MNILEATINIFLQLFLVASIYMFLHEACHYVASRLVGCNARLSLSHDGLVLSPSVTVEACRPSKLEETIILYMPYVLNIVTVLVVKWAPVQLIALLTLSNIILEKRRSPRRLIIATILVLFLTITLAPHVVALS